MQYRPRRLPCRFEVPMAVTGRSFETVITDVTEAGARVSGLGGVSRGEDVRFTVGNMPVTGTVMWHSGDGLCGLKFRQPLRRRQLELIRKPKTVGGQRRVLRGVHGFSELA